MRYISDDGKIFNTEQECCEHERQMEEEIARQKRLEMERNSRLDLIGKKYEELQCLISKYEEDYKLRKH